MCRRLEKGKIAPGVKLPTEEQLAEHFEVSSITIRAALKELAEIGIIERKQGIGTFVCKPGAGADRTEWSLSSIEDLIKTSRLSELAVMRHGFRPPPAWAKAELDPASRDRAFNLQVVRSQKNVPFLLTDAYFPSSLGRRLANADVTHELNRNKLLLAMVEEVTGERYASIRQSIVAVASPPEIARKLKISAHSPVLLVSRLSWGADGRLLQVARSYYQTKGFAYSIHLKRG